MKKETVVRPLLGAILALAVTAMLTMTVLAAGPYSITINGGDQKGMGGATRFTAYKIFKGEPKNFQGNHETLMGIEWGDGVTQDQLVAALKGSDLPVEGGTFGSKFTEAYNKWKGTHDSAITEAELVAQFLSQHLTDTYADDFARIVAGCVKGEGTKSTETGEGWEISGLAGGYYFVKDNYVSPEPDGQPDPAVSSYILRVVEDVSVPIKSSIPTVEKKVEGKDGYLAQIGQELTFTLTGTVAQNISEYETYSYKFTDTLSKGLDILNINRDDFSVKLGEHQFTKGTDYTAEVTNGEDGKHVLTVTFADLIAAAKNGKTTLNENSKIVVTYKAKLNGSAVAGGAGNPNDVKLEYSNDPYSDGKGESVPDEVKTYTLNLGIVKQSGDVEPKKLSGAKFKLKNAEGKYAKMEKQEGSSEENPVYSITGWADDEKDGSEITTGDGGTFTILGLTASADPGTKYTIVETAAPDGYEKMQDIVFNIIGSVDDEKNGALGTIALKRDSSNQNREDVQFGGNMDDGSGSLTLINYSSPILPNTGGIGAKVVYLVSGLAVLAGVCVVLAARKKGREDKG